MKLSDLELLLSPLPDAIVFFTACTCESHLLNYSDSK